MSERFFGSGLYLDNTFDLDVGQTGDLRSVEGVDELQKDLAFQLTILLDDLVGQPLDPETEAQVKSITIDVLTSDNRVEDVDRSGITVRKPRRDTITIQTPVIADNETRDLVFEI
jgi:hypothetical protein